MVNVSVTGTAPPLRTDGSVVALFGCVRCQGWAFVWLLPTRLRKDSTGDRSTWLLVRQRQRAR